MDIATKYSKQITLEFRESFVQGLAQSGGTVMLMLFCRNLLSHFSFGPGLGRHCR